MTDAEREALAKEQWDAANPDKVSKETLDALDEQNQQAFLTVMNVQQALDNTSNPTAVASNTGTTSTPGGGNPDLGGGGSGSGTGGSGDGGSGDGGTNVTPATVNVTPPVTGSPTNPSGFYYGFYDTSSLKKLPKTPTGYLPSTTSAPAPGASTTDFSQFAFPTQAPPTPSPTAQPSVQNVYPLFDT